MGDEFVAGAIAYAEAGGVLDPPPAWTLVGVTSLYDPRCLIEVDAMAILP